MHDPDIKKEEVGVEGQPASPTNNGILNSVTDVENMIAPNSSAGSNCERMHTNNVTAVVRQSSESAELGCKLDTDLQVTDMTTVVVQSSGDDLLTEVTGFTSGSNNNLPSDTIIECDEEKSNDRLAERPPHRPSDINRRSSATRRFSAAVMMDSSDLRSESGSETDSVRGESLKFGQARLSMKQSRYSPFEIEAPPSINKVAGGGGLLQSFSTASKVLPLVGGPKQTSKSRASMHSHTHGKLYGKKALLRHDSVWLFLWTWLMVRSDAKLYNNIESITNYLLTIL